MSYSFTKLFSSITESTVWVEPYPTRIAWVAMLANADRKGRVFASVPGLAKLAGVTLPEIEAALACFTSPDRYSRSKEHDGRRIEEIDGGWRLLNFDKYREMQDEEARKDYKRAWDRESRKRESDKSRQNPTDSDKSDGIRLKPTQAEAEAEAEADKSKTKIISSDASGVDIAPVAPEPAAEMTSGNLENLKTSLAKLRAGLPPSQQDAAAELAACLKANGCGGNPAHPQVMEWVTQGVSIETLKRAIVKGRSSKPLPEVIGVPYLAPIVEQILAGGDKPKAGPWATDEFACQAKAKELGLWPARAGESWNDLRARIRQKLAARAEESVR